MNYKEVRLEVAKVKSLGEEETEREKIKRRMS